LTSKNFGGSFSVPVTLEDIESGGSNGRDRMKYKDSPLPNWSLNRTDRIISSSGINAVTVKIP
jgi:hypothetical protein